MVFALLSVVVIKGISMLKPSLVAVAGAVLFIIASGSGCNNKADEKPVPTTATTTPINQATIGKTVPGPQITNNMTPEQQQAVALQQARIVQFQQMMNDRAKKAPPK